MTLLTRSDLIVGVAELLAAHISDVVWNASGAYSDPSKWGVFDSLVPQTPDRAVTLTVYGFGDNATQAETADGMQIRTRSAAQDPRPARDIDDRIADVLLGLFPVTLPNGVRLVQVERRSMTPLGLDDSRRWSFASNWALTRFNPSAHRV